MSKKILAEFTEDHLDMYCKRRGFTWTRWPSYPRTKHILKVNTSATQSTLFYVKIYAAENPQAGFWKVAHNFVEQLKKTECPWYIVLLLRSPQNGYIVPSKEAQRRINQNIWHYASDNEYTIHETPSEVQPNDYFDSFGQLTERIFSLVLIPN